MNRKTDTTSMPPPLAPSRRGFLGMATVASAAALVPLTASAGASCKTGRIPQSLDQRLASCIAELREILGQMHPEIAKMHPHYLASRQDGSFRFSLQGDVEFQPFQGEGLYLVSVDGHVWEHLVREERVVTVSGHDLGWSRYFGRARAQDGGWDDYERCITNFVRKIGEVPA